MRVDVILAVSSFEVLFVVLALFVVFVVAIIVFWYFPPFNFPISYARCWHMQKAPSNHSHTHTHMHHIFPFLRSIYVDNVVFSPPIPPLPPPPLPRSSPWANDSVDSAMWLCCRSHTACDLCAVCCNWLNQHEFSARSSTCTPWNRAFCYSVWLLVALRVCGIRSSHQFARDRNWKDAHTCVLVLIPKQSARSMKHCFSEPKQKTQRGDNIK